MQNLYTEGNFDLKQQCLLPGGSDLTEFVSQCAFVSHTAVCTTEIRNQMTFIANTCGTIVTDHTLPCPAGCKDAIEVYFYIDIFEK